MERRAFELLSKMEASWWYRGRAYLVTRLGRAFLKPYGKVLDYGAGSGGMRAALAVFGNDIIGFEPDREAREEARVRGYSALYASEEEALASTFDVAVFCDVLEHIKDDHGTLARVVGSLNQNGVVIITVPAFQSLWSIHDVNHHHFRRYSRREVIRLLEGAGLTLVYASYWNATLFPVAALMRIVGRSGESSLGLPRFLNDVLLAIIRIEVALMRFIRLPFGTGLIAIGIKRG